MRGWRDTQLAAGALFTTEAPSSSPAWKTRSPPRGGSAFSPLPTPTASSSAPGLRPPIQYGRKRIIEKPIFELARN